MTEREGMLPGLVEYLVCVLIVVGTLCIDGNLAIAIANIGESLPRRSRETGISNCSYGCVVCL